MAKINTYATATPAIGDKLIGTDISDTGNDANGETVNFTASSLLALGQGRILLNSATISSDANIDFTLDTATYRHFILEFERVIPATDNVAIFVYTSSDGGSTFDSGASDYDLMRVIATGTGTFSDGTNSGHIVGTNIGSDTNEHGVNGYMQILNPALTTYTHMFSNTFYAHQSSGGIAAILAWSQRNSNADVDAVRIAANSGNLESGTIYLYGIE